MRSDLVVF
jgi:hypothetical protein